MALEGSHLEKEPETIVRIKWGEDILPQKFVDFFDSEANYYVYSCPKSEARQHMDMTVKAVQEFGIKGGVSDNHGGFIKRKGNKILITGESIALGAFNTEKTLEALKKEFPENEIEYIK